MVAHQILALFVRVRVLTGQQGKLKNKITFDKIRTTCGSLIKRYFLPIVTKICLSYHSSI